MRIAAYGVWCGWAVRYLCHTITTHILYPHTNTYPSPSSRWAGDSSGGATAATAAVWRGDGRAAGDSSKEDPRRGVGG